MKNAHLPFDRPFDTLRVPSKVEGLMALSHTEGLRFPHGHRKVTSIRTPALRYGGVYERNLV